jgi:hypothetical protein
LATEAGIKAITDESRQGFFTKLGPKFFKKFPSVSRCHLGSESPPYAVPDFLRIFLRIFLRRCSRCYRVASTFSQPVLSTAKILMTFSSAAYIHSCSTQKAALGNYGPFLGSFNSFLRSLPTSSCRRPLWPSPCCGCRHLGVLLPAPGTWSTWTKTCFKTWSLFDCRPRWSSYFELTIRLSPTQSCRQSSSFVPTMLLKSFLDFGDDFYIFRNSSLLSRRHCVPSKSLPSDEASAPASYWFNFIQSPGHSCWYSLIWRWIFTSASDWLILGFGTFAKSAFSEKSATFTVGHNFGLNPQGHWFWNFQSCFHCLIWSVWL